MAQWPDQLPFQKKTQKRRQFCTRQRMQLVVMAAVLLVAGPGQGSRFGCRPVNVSMPVESCGGTEFIYTTICARQCYHEDMQKALIQDHAVVRKGSIFYKSRRSLQNHLEFMYRFSQGLRLRQLNLMDDGVVGSSRTLTKMVSSMRKVCIRVIYKVRRQGNMKVGGRHHFLMLDKSKFSHKRKTTMAGSTPAGLKVILGENNIEKLTLTNGIPESLDDLLSEIKTTFGLKGNLILQYMDQDFDNDFFNLNSTTELQDLGTIKVIHQQTNPPLISATPSTSPPSVSFKSDDSASLASNDTITLSSPESVSSRTQQWPEDFAIPQFSYDTELQLES